MGWPMVVEVDKCEPAGHEAGQMVSCWIEESLKYMPQCLRTLILLSLGKDDGDKINRSRPLTCMCVTPAAAVVPKVTLSNSNLNVSRKHHMVRGEGSYIYLTANASTPLVADQDWYLCPLLLPGHCASYCNRKLTFPLAVFG